MTASQLALLMVCVPVTMAVLALVSRLRLQARLASRMRLLAFDAGHDRDSGLAQSSVVLRGHVARLLAALGRLMPLGGKDREKIVIALRRAGYDGPGVVAIVLGSKVASLLVGIAFGFAVLPGFLSSVSALFAGVVGLLGALVGGMLLGVVLNLVPELVVAQLGAMRYRRIQAGFADAMDLLIVCLQAGMTFERAMQRTVANLSAFHRDLGAELRRASLDMSVHGRTRQDAVARLAGRLGSPEFGDFAVTVGQSERHGTPLAEALRKLAAATRVELVANMQAKLARLPVLLILPTLAFVLPGILVIVGGPAFVQLTTTLSGVGE